MTKANNSTELGMFEEAAQRHGPGRQSQYRATRGTKRGDLRQMEDEMEAANEGTEYLLHCNLGVCPLSKQSRSCCCKMLARLVCTSDELKLVLELAQYVRRGE